MVYMESKKSSWCVNFQDIPCLAWRVEASLFFFVSLSFEPRICSAPLSTREWVITWRKLRSKGGGKQIDHPLRARLLSSYALCALIWVWQHFQPFQHYATMVRNHKQAGTACSITFIRGHKVARQGSCNVFCDCVKKALKCRKGFSTSRPPCSVDLKVRRSTFHLNGLTPPCSLLVMRQSSPRLALIHPEMIDDHHCLVRVACNSALLHHCLSRPVHRDSKFAHNLSRWCPKPYTFFLVTDIPAPHQSKYVLKQAVYNSARYYAHTIALARAIVIQWKLVIRIVIRISSL